MLFSTSLVALILSPRRLQIQNTKVCHIIWTLMSRWSFQIDMELMFELATMHNMRVNISNYSACGEAEPQATSYCPRGSNIPVRYSDNEAFVYY